MWPFLSYNRDFRFNTLVWDKYRFMSMLILGVGQISHKLSQQEQIRLLINFTSFQVGEIKMKTNELPKECYLNTSVLVLAQQNVSKLMFYFCFVQKALLDFLTMMKVHLIRSIQLVLVSTLKKHSFSHKCAQNVVCQETRRSIVQL